jgi:RNA polymerase sigma-70 factor (ECF subfamily)
MGDMDSNLTPSIEEIVQKHYHNTLKRVRRLVPLDDAEDVTQIIFMAITEHLDSYEGKSALAAWMRSIERKKIADYYRKQEKRKRLNIALLSKRHLGNEVVEALADEVLLEQVMKRIPSTLQKEILYLKVIEEMTFHEVEVYLGVHYEAVRSRYRRAIKNAKAILKGT